MIYEKAQVEVVLFENGISFMTVSYASAEAALAAECGGYSGTPQNFQCNSFGGYGPDNPPHTNQHSSVTIGDGVYVFDYHGNHWACVQV